MFLFHTNFMEDLGDVDITTPGSVHLSNGLSDNSASSGSGIDDDAVNPFDGSDDIEAFYQPNGVPMHHCASTRHPHTTDIARHHTTTHVTMNPPPMVRVSHHSHHHPCLALV